MLIMDIPINNPDFYIPNYNLGSNPSNNRSYNKRRSDFHYVTIAPYIPYRLDFYIQDIPNVPLLRRNQVGK